MADKTEKTGPQTTASQGTPSTGSTTDGGRAQNTESRAQELAVDANEPRIDPRLDNRTGDQRPKLETFPAKPQQVDGPELGEEKAFAARAEREDVGTRKGAKSPGPHGLGDTAGQV